MAFFRSVSAADTFSAIHDDGIFLRVPESSDYAQWSALREASRDFLSPWEPTWPPDDLSRGAFRRRLRRYADDMRADLAYPFFLFERNQNHLLGGLTLTNVRRGVAQAASLGYWIGLPYARRGFMSAGVRALLPFAFEALRLHRVEAACIPGNAASMRLLEKCGFKPEGRAREYLCINGVWQDHLLYACLNGDRS